MRKTQLWLLITLLLSFISIGGDEPPNAKPSPAWRDSVSFRLPESAASTARASNAAGWLKRHVLPVSVSKDQPPIRVIAWKDPTLDGDDPKLLAGYLITDTLWAAKALKPFDPATSLDLEAGLQRLDWYGNGLHDVLFHPIDSIRHRPADQDYVHGFSLGRYPVSEGRTVDLRVFREKVDAKYSVGHPRLFAEHAVYEALFDHWQGRTEQARRRILDVVTDDRKIDPEDRIFWDDEAGVLVDFVNLDAWRAFHRGERAACRHFTFKLGVLLYAARLLGMEHEIGPALGGMKQRLWSAQTDSGGLAHFVDVRSRTSFTTGAQPTGEASAIAILAEVVVPPRP